MYWDQSAAVKIDNVVGEYQNIKRGVRQGCVLSPDLFSLYSENIMKNIEDMTVIKVGGQNFNNLRYADDTVLGAKSEIELQALLDTVIKESEMRGLSLNTKKTEVIVISKGKEHPKCTVYAKGNKLRQAVCVKYLGTILTSDGRRLTEIKSRIAQAKTAFQRMRTIRCTNQHL